MLGQQADGNVGFVTVSHSDDEIGTVDFCLTEDARARCITLNRLNIEAVIDAMNQFSIGVDDRHLVAFGRQPLSEVKTDHSGSDDDDAHFNLQASSVRRRPLRL